VPIILHSTACRPIGQYFVNISTNVSGMVTRHNSRSVNRQIDGKLFVIILSTLLHGAYPTQLN
jgi:hypothetical protein